MRIIPAILPLTLLALATVSPAQPGPANAPGATGATGRRVAPPAGPAQRGRPGRPVDQTVGDLGPLNASLRRVEPGIAKFSNRISLYQRFDPARWQRRTGATRRNAGGLRLPQSYKYRAPGVEAYVDQPRYLTPRGRNVPIEQAPEDDPRYRQIIGPNTVFDLIPGDQPDPRASLTPDQPAASRRTRANGIGPRHRVSTRIDGRVDGLIPGRITGRVPDSSRNRSSADYRHGPGAPAATGQTQHRRARAIARALRQRRRQGQPDRPGTESDQAARQSPARFGPNHPARQDADDDNARSHRVKPSKRRQQRIERALQADPGG